MCVYMRISLTGQERDGSRGIAYHRGQVGSYLALVFYSFNVSLCFFLADNNNVLRLTESV
jgi:hypothetical protein